MSAASLEPIDALLAGLLDEHRAETGARRVIWRCELDPLVRVPGDERSLAALRRLLSLILATVPDGCEVYLAVTREVGPVTRVGSGRLVARWQVAGSAPERGGWEVVPLHPVAGDAIEHAASALAGAVREAFEAAGWGCEIDGEGRSGELVVVGSLVPGR